MQYPIINNRKSISPVWLLPFIALCISGWLLYTSIQEAGVDITIHFESATGITPGKTEVIYKGIPVGRVKDVEIANDLQGVILHVEIDKKAQNSLVEDTKFWIIRPEVSAGRISGLETLLSGSYIAVKAGKSATHSRTFTGLTVPPPTDADAPGLHITLKSPTLHSLQRGSYIYSKNLQIGQVEDYVLESDGTISLQVFIKPEFSHLIRKNTRFWNASGLSVAGDLQTGMEVNMVSLAALIYGGITCTTPEQKTDNLPAESGENFTLYKDFEDAEHGIPMTLQLGSGDGVIAGKTKVLYRGLKVGVVKNIDINDDTFHSVTASILLDPRAEFILRQDTRFWIIRPQVSIEGIRNIETLISGAYITFQPGGGTPLNHFQVKESPMPIPTLRSGTHFFLEAKDGGSLSIGAPISFRKMVVGEITDITLAANGNSVRTKIVIYTPFDQLVHTDSVFWNASGVQVNASLSNVEINLSSLRAILAGGITFTNPSTNSSKEPAITANANTIFTLYEGYPEAVANEVNLQPRGLTLQVESDKPGNVRIGSPVLYNNIIVGKVMGLTLAQENTQILINLLIYDTFQHLINDSSKFYTISGIKAEASLQGFSLESGPLEALISGGIAFITPEKKKPLRTGKRFRLYSDLDNAYNADSLHLTLRLHNAKDIHQHTKIRYQGIEVGHITDLRFDGNLDQIVAEAVVQQQAEKLFRADSILYLVSPQVSLSGVQNLETIISGSYITLYPGTGKPADEFTVLLKEPVRNEILTGLNIILESDTLGSLKPGKPIYYRQVQVGSITGYELSPTAQSVWIFANIHPMYQHLVHTGTKFWKVSGIEVSGGLFGGLTVNTESMETLVLGGVALATPEGDAMGKPAQNNDHFPLSPKAISEWKSWMPKLTTIPSTAADADNTDNDEKVHLATETKKKLSHKK